MTEKPKKSPKTRATKRRRPTTTIQTTTVKQDCTFHSLRVSVQTITIKQDCTFHSLKVSIQTIAIKQDCTFHSLKVSIQTITIKQDCTFHSLKVSIQTITIKQDCTFHSAKVAMLNYLEIISRGILTLSINIRQVKEDTKLRQIRNRSKVKPRFTGFTASYGHTEKGVVNWMLQKIRVYLIKIR
jgi:hypothetical protein